MTQLQQLQISELSRYGWKVAAEKEDRVEMLHVTVPNGAFAVTYVDSFGSFTWEGSYPLARLSTMYPSFSLRPDHPESSPSA